MDPTVVETLEKAGIRPTLEEVVPHVVIQLDDEGYVVPLEDDVAVVQKEASTSVTLRPASELFTGAAVPPDFTKGPTRDYLHFFLLVERTAAEYCSVSKERIRDKEFEEIYNHLRRRPDGTHENPVFSYLRAAARLYMSLRDVSQAEYEAVMRRLSQSGRSFAMGPASTNYLDVALSKLLR